MTPARRHSRQGGRALPCSRRPKTPLEPTGRSPFAGSERQGSAAERARAGGTTIREARARSRGRSFSERYEATERARSGGVPGLPQAPPNVTRVTTPARRSGRGDAERRADIGDAERATSSERGVEPTERRRPCRACAGRMRRTCAPVCVAVRRVASVRQVM